MMWPAIFADNANGNRMEKLFGRCEQRFFGAGNGLLPFTGWLDFVFYETREEQGQGGDGIRTADRTASDAAE